MSEKNGTGPDFCGYYKHLVSMLYAENGCEELDYEETMVASSEGGILKDLSGSEQERLQVILNESIAVLNEEVDEILGHTLAKFQSEADRNKKVLLPSSCLGEAKKASLSPHKRKLKKSACPTVPVMPGKMGEGSHAFQGKAEICEGPSKRESERLCDKLVQMQEDLEGYLNVIVSKCRTMTSSEKQKLGQQISNLPPKALNRVVMIVRHQNYSGKNPDEVHVDLDRQDNTTLWRLYYYVKSVERASTIF